MRGFVTRDKTFSLSNLQPSNFCVGLTMQLLWFMYKLCTGDLLSAYLLYGDNTTINGKF